MRRGMFFLLLALASCRPCATPQISPPSDYAEGGYIDSCMKDEPEGSLVDWWKQFDDPLLTCFIEKGLECNQDLRIARERICEARAIWGIEFSRLLPHIDAFALFSRMRNSQTLSDADFSGGTFINFFQAGFDTLWEIDLFGKNLSRARAAAYDIAGAAEEVRNVHVSVASEIAIHYFRILAIQERIGVTKNHIAVEQELVDLVTERFEAGLIPELDVFTAKALLQERRAILPEQEGRLYKTIYALGVLLGTNPENMISYFCEPRPLPCRKGKIPLGLPSELLCRRGDVRAAEFTMLASGARVMAARKEIFPTISLDAFFSYATGFATQWFKGPSREWNLLPSIFLPIFHGGKILSNIRAETSIQRQSVLAYEKSVLEALREVESALVGYFQEGARIDALQKEVDANRSGRKMANTLYFGGKENFLFVLETERDLYVSESFLVESKEFLMTELVAIYKALGGGWECCD